MDTQFKVYTTAIWSGNHSIVNGALITLSSTKGGTFKPDNTVNVQMTPTLTKTLYVTYLPGGTGSDKITATLTYKGYSGTSNSTTITVTLPPPPVAAFHTEPAGGAAPLTVNFYDDSTGSHIGRVWDFGDGSTGTDKNATHTYNDPSTYQVKLTVNDAYGRQAEAYGSVDVTAPAATEDVAGTPEPSLDSMPTPTTDAAPSETPTAEASTGTGPTPTAVIGGTFGENAEAGGISQLVRNVSSLILDNWLFIAIAILALLILLAVFLILWFRTKLKVEPRKGSLPCDGSSTMPVRVTLVNTFGVGRKSKQNREVKLEATSGTIQDAVIPSMGNYVDTVLKSSNECGPVNITAASGGKIATATVNFASVNPSLELTPSPGDIPADGKSSSNITIKFKDGDKYISNLEDKTIALSTTLGKVTSPVRILPRASSGNAMLTAGEAGGTAVVSATSGKARGECQVTFKGAAKRFCMHCGSSMAMEASQCPKCGLTPPSGVDVKQCTMCNVVIPESAKYCDKCGARQPDNREMASQPPVQQPKKE